MIGIGQDHSTPRRRELVGGDPLDRRLGPHRHERRGFQAPMRCAEDSRSGQGRAVEARRFKPDRAWQRVLSIDAQGLGICRSRQILRAKSSLISLCRGTADEAAVAGLK